MLWVPFHSADQEAGCQSAGPAAGGHSADQAAGCQSASKQKIFNKLVKTSKQKMYQTKKNVYFYFAAIAVIFYAMSALEMPHPKFGTTATKSM